jgi:uncharacterized protein
MYEKVNKLTETHLRVLSIFTNGFERDYYIREVQKLLKISPRTAQLILNNLEKRTILESKSRGKIKVYKIKKNIIAKQYLVLAENYKKIRFLEQKPLIKQIIEKIMPFVDGVMVVFGSYAKNLEKNNSDLDIFIIGKHKRQKIKEVSNTYGIKINVKQYGSKLFEMKWSEDILVREVLNNHILIKGTEQFIDVIL